MFLRVDNACCYGADAKLLHVEIAKSKSLGILQEFSLL